MFEPEKLPAPDEMGFFFHPDIPGEDENDDVRGLCKELGFDTAFVAMDGDAPQDLVDAYFENEETTATTRWTPTMPGGDGWMLAAKYDTEEGPYAMFVRPDSY